MSTTSTPVRHSPAVSLAPPAQLNLIRTIRYMRAESAPEPFLQSASSKFSCRRWGVEQLHAPVFVSVTSHFRHNQIAQPVRPADRRHGRHSLSPLPTDFALSYLSSYQSNPVIRACSMNPPTSSSLTGSHFLQGRLSCSHFAASHCLYSLGTWLQNCVVRRLLSATTERIVVQH